MNSSSKFFSFLHEPDSLHKMVIERDWGWWSCFFLTIFRQLDPEMSSYDDHLAAFCIHSLNLTSGDDVLDAGCGAGDVAIRLALRGMDVTGIDISSELISHCKDAALRVPSLDQSQVPSLKFLVEDMRLPLNLKNFESIICLGVTFGYFEESLNEACFQNLAALLPRGGRLLIESDDPCALEEGWIEKSFILNPLSHSNGMSLNLRRRFVKGKSSYEGFFNITLEDGRKIVLSEALNKGCDEHIRIYSKDELSEIATRSGMRLEEVYGDSVLPLRSYVPGISRRLVSQFIRI